MQCDLRSIRYRLPPFRHRPLLHQILKSPYMSPSITACEHDRRNRYPGKATARPFPYKTNVPPPVCAMKKGGHRNGFSGTPAMKTHLAIRQTPPCRKTRSPCQKKPVPAFFFLYPDQTTFPYVPEPDRHRISVMVKARCLGYSSPYRHVPDNEETR